VQEVSNTKAKLYCMVCGAKSRAEHDKKIAKGFYKHTMIKRHDK
jgi:hypothetical protein